MKVVLFAVSVATLVGFVVFPGSKKPTRLKIVPGFQDSSSRKILARFLGQDFPDSTYVVCGRNGHFAVISEINADQRIVYFCEGNKSDTIRSVDRKQLVTPLGESSLHLHEALQLKGNFLLLMNPSGGNGYATWIPQVYMLDDWSPRQTTREVFTQFCWPDEWIDYYECTTSFDEVNGKLFARSDTSFYDDQHRLIRFSGGRKLLICVD